MNNILWCLIALIFNPFTIGVTLYLNGLLWISLDFTAKPVMNLNNWSMVVVGLVQVGYVSLVIKKYKRKWGNRMKETCDFCNNLGYASTYNTQDEKDEIQRCDECFSNNKPWAFASDEDAKKESEATKWQR